LIINRLLKYFKSLQNPGKINSVGRPPVSSKTIQQKKFYIGSLNERLMFVIKSERERCLIIGILLIAAGVFNEQDPLLKLRIPTIIDEKILDKVKKTELDYLIAMVKTLLPKKNG
jgi:hypothetical protein